MTSQPASRDPVFGPSWRQDWRATLGPAWVPLLVAFAICLFIGGATTPLSDADLPMHLALGEWIVQHRAVPFIEPFAWTRAGDPFYAYSWAAEVTYYSVLSGLGPAGLQVFQGLTIMSGGIAIWLLGAVARWSGWTTLLMTALHIIVSVGIVPSLRPQGIVSIVLPLTWALVMLARDSSRIALPLVGLAVCSAAAANSHLFFPLTAFPGVAMLLPERIDWRRTALVAAAILVGWFATPYALSWPDIFRLNFEPHALYSSPSPVDEYMPGFTALFRGGSTALLIAPLLLALPWLTAASLTVRERTLYGMLWVVGMVGFGVAIRGLLPWWLAMLPVTASAIGRLAVPLTPIVLTTQRAVVAAIFGATAGFGGGIVGDPWAQTGTIETRRLPSSSASGIEPIAEWLDCQLTPNAQGRLLTTFNFGSYARWRMPRLSESIDGRTIFPDSVAAAETYFLPMRPNVPLPPWRSADLAILPLGVPVSAVLDTASSWMRVATTAERNGPAAIIGLWVNKEWWARSSEAPLPARRMMLFHRPEPAACS